MSKMTKCKNCSKDMIAIEKYCPECGAKNRKPIYKSIWLWGIVIILFFMAIFEDGESTREQINSNKGEEEISQNISQEKDDTPKTEEELIEDGYILVGERDGDTIVLYDGTDKNVSSEFKAALKSAENYNDKMHMSKADIYEQLTSEYGDHFPEDAVKYAMDNLKADWKKNALETAKYFSESMYMSKADIYEQLTSEYGSKFTEEEAKYAIDNLKADWKKNALETAKYYRKEMNMSDKAIYDQLISEYGSQFTEEEAKYAIDNLK